MAKGRTLSVILVFSLLVDALSIPTDIIRRQRAVADNELPSKETNTGNSLASNSSNGGTSQIATTSVTTLQRDIKEIFGTASSDSPSASTSPSPAASSTSAQTAKPYDIDQDDDDFFNDSEPTYPTNGGGSSILSLLNLAGAFFPSSSSGSSILKNMIHQVMIRMQKPKPSPVPRQDIADNVIEIDYDLKPPQFERQETDEVDDDESSESNSEEEDNAAEESLEGEKDGDDNSNASKQDSALNEASNDNNDSDFDSDEPPEGDGQGGGILGLLAGLSGGEDGESDLGTLLAAVSGIVANLSGDGFDLNSLIGSAIGLFAGLLSEGAENPGEIIASYLLTSLDTITGGGAKNNGAFFGKFLSKLIKGTSAGGDPDASSEENENAMQMKDSAGFVASFLMSVLGDMSKGSSGGSSHPW